ncbi:hypothetical protein CS542_07750 [Pedobacter sp. IW39]|nr:hypothetical protein CS542_07750 [Pedobacter sp. IW39]
MIMAGKGNPEKEVMTMVATKSGPYFIRIAMVNIGECVISKEYQNYDVVETENELMKVEKLSVNFKHISATFLRK